jgi:hypothetical protein
MATQINFEEELRKLINTFSLEPESDTPDFILVEYISGCLDTFNKAVTRNSTYHKIKQCKKANEKILLNNKQ